MLFKELLISLFTINFQSYIRRVANLCNFMFFLRTLKGSKGYYFLGVIALVISVMFGVLEPLVIKTAVDYCINGKVINDNLVSGIMLHTIDIQNITEVLSFLALTIVFVNVMNLLFLFVKGYFSSICSQKIGNNLRKQLYSHVQQVTTVNLGNIQTGDWVQRCTSDVTTIVSFLENNFVEIVRVGALIIFASVSMYLLNPTLAITGVCLIPVLMAFSIVFYKKINVHFQKADEEEGKLTNYLNEYATGIRSFKAFACHEKE
jgi:ATP-binding cassette, subfamily B, bacterial